MAKIIEYPRKLGYVDVIVNYDKRHLNQYSFIFYCNQTLIKLSDFISCSIDFI